MKLPKQFRIEPEPVLNRASVEVIRNFFIKLSVEYSSPLEGESNADYLQLPEGAKETGKIVLPILSQVLDQVEDKLKPKQTLRRDEIRQIVAESFIEIMKKHGNDISYESALEKLKNIQLLSPKEYKIFNENVEDVPELVLGMLSQIIGVRGGLVGLFNNLANHQSRTPFRNK